MGKGAGYEKRRLYQRARRDHGRLRELERHAGLGRERLADGSLRPLTDERREFLPGGTVAPGRARDAVDVPGPADARLCLGMIHSRRPYLHERADRALLSDRRAFDRLELVHAFRRLGAIGSAFAGAAPLSAGLSLGQILPLMADVPLTGAVAGLVKRRAPGAGRRIKGNGRDFCGGGFREYLTRAVTTALKSGRPPPSCRSRQPSPRSTSG